jgi:Zn-dependent oligopeptidase
MLAVASLRPTALCTENLNCVCSQKTVDASWHEMVAYWSTILAGGLTAGAYQYLRQRRMHALAFQQAKDHEDRAVAKETACWSAEQI